MQQLVVIGGGPAGAAAALRARQLDATVTVIDRASFPRTRPCSGWLGPSAVALLGELGITAQQVGAGVFHGLTLHSWDLRSSFEIQADDLTGWLVDRAALDHTLLKVARKAGAKVVLGKEVIAAEFGEQSAVFQLADDKSVEGAVALLADGARSSMAQAAHIASAGSLPGLARTAYLPFRAPKKNTRLDVAVAASRAGQVLTIAQHAGSGRISLMTREPDSEPAELLAAFLTAAEESGLLPALNAGKIEVGTSPAGLALDLDAHVGKRSLLIGDAGGFVGAFSNEGLFPALRSGCLASEIAIRAIRSDPVQDALQEFGPTWRQELAEYLRMPNTDLALLMPLVFKNQQMAERVARAYLCGVSF